MGILDIKMELGLGELSFKFVNNEEFNNLMEGVLRKSPVWNKYAEEYANKFAAEERLPLKQEYLETIEDLCNKVMDEDEAIHKRLAFLTLRLTIFDENFMDEMRKEFAQELEAFEQSKSTQ